MSSAQTFVTTPRGWTRRCFAYFLIFGAVGLLLVFLGHKLDVSTSDVPPGIAYTVLGAFTLLGAFGCLIDRAVILDPEHRKLSETVRFLPFVICLRYWTFEALECVVERSGYYSDSDVCWRWIGVRTSVNSIVWLRWFHTPTIEPTSDVLAFRAELAQLTGLQHDYELDWRWHNKHEIHVA